ncbi:hypothetical protein AcW1_009678 [Taiwanofungus camphoratus]|nr:hypothetical protein AcW1_009678 [Antrodia cinnamomea]
MKPRVLKAPPEPSSLVLVMKNTGSIADGTGSAGAVSGNSDGTSPVGSSSGSSGSHPGSSRISSTIMPTIITVIVLAGAAVLVIWIAKRMRRRRVSTTSTRPTDDVLQRPQLWEVTLDPPMASMKSPNARWNCVMPLSVNYTSTPTPFPAHVSEKAAFSWTDGASRRSSGSTSSSLQDVMKEKFQADERRLRVTVAIAMPIPSHVHEHVKAVRNGRGLAEDGPILCLGLAEVSPPWH